MTIVESPGLITLGKATSEDRTGLRFGWGWTGLSFPQERRPASKIMSGTAVLMGKRTEVSLLAQTSLVEANRMER